MSGSEIYKAAENLERLCKRLVAKMKAQPAPAPKQKKDRKGRKESEEDEKGSEESCQVSFDEKMEFTEKVAKLSNEGLTKLVRMLQEECPQVLEDTDNETIQVTVDVIEREVFERLARQLDEFPCALEPSAKRQKTA